MGCVDRWIEARRERRLGREVRRFHEVLDHARISEIKKLGRSGSCLVRVDCEPVGALVFMSLEVPKTIAEGLVVGHRVTVDVEFEDMSRWRERQYPEEAVETA